MTQSQLSAIFLIAGFVFILAASTVGPPRLYQKPDVAVQLELIANHQTTWALSNLFYALAGVATALGLAIFSIHLLKNDDVTSWLVIAGAAAYVLGVAAYAIFLYRRTVDPAALFTNYAFTPLTAVFLGAIVTGLLLYGVAYLQAGYPGWLGITTIAGTVLIGGAALIFPVRFFASFPPQLLFLFTLAAGIVILRQ